MTSESSRGAPTETCVAVFRGERHPGCEHAATCHVSGGCHVPGCECDFIPGQLCGVEIHIDPTKGCAEYESDRLCGCPPEEHCTVTDPYENHICNLNMEHHAYVAPRVHAETPRWNHRVQRPRVTKEVSS